MKENTRCTPLSNTGKKQAHTPGVMRQAQDLAAALGHLNKGLPPLTDLYAAAPELLAVLTKIVNGGNPVSLNWSHFDTKGLIAQARAAIAKAEGEK